VRALTDTGAEIERAERDVVVDSHGALGLGTSELFNGFRDLNYAYRFGPLTYDVVVAELFDAHARRCSETYFLPAGAARPRLPGLGLEAHAARISEREWMLECSSDLFAQYVSIDAHGFEPSDSWFHLAPHSSRAVLLRANGDERQPHGSVRALNGPTVRIAVDSE
jgi:beta-mannosidase